MTLQEKKNQIEKLKHDSIHDSFLFLGDKIYTNFTGHNLILNEAFSVSGNIIFPKRILSPIGHALCDKDGNDLSIKFPDTVSDLDEKSVIVSDSYFFFKRRRMSRRIWEHVQFNRSNILFFGEIPFRVFISESEFFYRFTDNELLFKKHDNRYIQLFDEIVDCTKFDKETPQNAEKK